MKKFWSGLLIVCMVLVFAGCSSSNDSDNLTMDKFIEAFDNSGEDITNGIPTDGNKGINKDEKPQYESIGATDAVIFNIGNSPVKIFEYKSTDKLKKAKEKYSALIEDDISKGRFLLETNSEKAKEIFNGVE